MKRIPRVLRFIAPLLIAGACSSDGGSGPPQPAALTSSGGVTASATVGSVVSPAVTVTDSKGVGLEGITVTFEVSGGGGTVASSSVATDANGRASTSWTLGTAVGGNTLVARSGGLAPVTFNTTGTADAPSSLTAVAGNLTSGAVGTALVTPPGVLVRDRFNNPVPGAQVTFSAGNNSGTVAGGSATSGPDGVARPTSWTLGGVVGTQTLNVTSGTANTVLSVNATAGAPFVVTPQSGTGQTVAVATPVPTRPSVRVLDQFGNPVVGVTVTFTAGAGSGTVTGASQTTDASGFATVGGWTLGTAAGTQSLSAAAGSVSTVITATAVAGPASVITKIAGDNQTAQPGAPVAVQPRVRVNDAFGNLVIGGSVTFQVTAGGGAITSANATTDVNGFATPGVWTLGAAGVNTLRASSGVATPVTFNATASADAPVSFVFTRFAGQNTTCPVSSSGCSFTVQVRNAAGQAVPNEAIRWQNGATTLTMNTNQFGRATATNLAQSAVVGAGTQTATLIASGEVLTFNYNVVLGGGYNIDVQFIGSATASQQAIFTQAAQKWQQVITGDLAPVVNVSIPAGACGIAHPAFTGTVDDMLIYIQVVPIDGVNGVLGSAGFCSLRDAQDGDEDMPWLGIMRLDEADVAAMEQSGRLLSVVQHEIGHILGIGTLWNRRGLVQGTCSVDPFFNGVRAIPGFQLAGGTLVNGVPVENGGGEGTICSHWRESTLTNELMTGFNNAGANPLSAITIGSLMDLGYQVNFGTAENFVLQGTTAGLRAGPSAGDFRYVEVPYTPPAPGVVRPGRR